MDAFRTEDGDNRAGTGRGRNSTKRAVRTTFDSKDMDTHMVGAAGSADSGQRAADTVPSD